MCWSLDRIGRSLKQVVVLLDDLQALGVSFVSVREGLDWTTPSGRLQAQLLSMIAELERARIRERVCARVARAKAQGRRLGRPERENRISAGRSSDGSCPKLLCAHADGGVHTCGISRCQ